MTWYKDWFGEDYLKVYPHRDEKEARRQVKFVDEIIPLKYSWQLLDLGCGTGRHALELTRLGYRVTCLDLSSVLLKLAKQKSDEKDARIRFVRADMRFIPFADAFDAVLSFFTTFGYFKTDEENQKTLLSIRTALRKGGYFFLDYLNKAYVIKNLVPLDSRETADFDILQERHYNRAEERIEKTITLKENGEERQYFESVRLYTLEEMKSMLHKAGLRLENVFGDFDGDVFYSESPRLILVGRREA